MTMNNKESVAQLLKETIVQLCKANIFYSGQVEIDGIICISGQVEGQELVIKVHEIFATPQDLRSPYAAIGYQPLGAKFLDLQNYYDDYQSRELKRRRLESGGDLRPSFAYSYLSKLIYERNNPSSFVESSLDQGNGVTDLSIKSSLANSSRRFDQRSEGSCSPQHATEAKYDVHGETVPASSQSPTHSFVARKVALEKDVWSPGKSFSSSSPVCRVCAYSFDSSEALSSHNETVHSVFTCLCCFKTFTSRSNLERHSRLHTGHRPYACEVCGKSFSRKDHLSNHATKHALKCSTCLQRCADRRTLISHCLYEHGTALTDICGFCNKGFCSVELYEEHVKSHPQSNAGDPKSSPESCVKSVARSSSRERHSCAKCSFETNDKVSLLKHRLTHSPECRLYTCLGCGKIYEDPLQYSDHLMLHQKDRDIFECCICRQVCGSLSSLRRHEAAHVATDDNSDMEIVAEADRFRCGECNRTFETLAILQEHLDVHVLSRRQHLCHRCHGTFENLADLELHVKTSEGRCGVPPEENPPRVEDRLGVVDVTSRRDKRKRKQPKPVLKILSSERDGVEGSDVEVTELMSPDVAGDFRRCDFVITDNPANVIPVSDAEIKMEPAKGILNDATTSAELQNDLIKLENRGLVSVLSVKPKGSDDCVERQADRDNVPHAVRATPRQRGRGRGRRRFASADRPHRLSAVSDRLMALSEGRLSPNDNDASLNNNSITARNENCPSGVDVPLGPFVCIVCNFEASSFPLLDDHCATLHSRSPCMFCPKTFAQRANRDRHHCLHTGDKPYGCPDCDERFSRGDKLKMHRVRAHGVEYPAYGSRHRDSSSRDRDFAASPVFSAFPSDVYSPVLSSVYLAGLPSLAIFESHGQREVDDIRAGGDAARGNSVDRVDDRVSEFRRIGLNLTKNWEIENKTGMHWEKMRPEENEIDELNDAPKSASASN